jgi:hypothetical protein
MTLMISLYGRELDRVHLEPDQMKEPGYIQQQVHELKARHAEVLEKAFPVAAVIYIEGVQSGMNGDYKINDLQ